MTFGKNDRCSIKKLRLGKNIESLETRILLAGDSSFWSFDEIPTGPTGVVELQENATVEVVQIDFAQLQNILAKAKTQFDVNAKDPLLLTVPTPNGNTEEFQVWETSVMSPKLAAKFPHIKTYAGQGLEDPTDTIRFTTSPGGLRAHVNSTDGAYSLDRYSYSTDDAYVSYFANDLKLDLEANASFHSSHEGHEHDDHQDDDSHENAHEPRNAKTPPVFGSELRTFRFAVATTWAYTNYHSRKVTNPTQKQLVDNALSAIADTVNDLNGIFEREFSIKLELVADNDDLIATSATSDPFKDSKEIDHKAGKTQSVIDDEIGDKNYDVGHVFHKIGGGFSGVALNLGIAGKSGQKAKGASSHEAPGGTSFTRLVAHEVGHQFGANHTFNADSGNCASSGQWSNNTGYERGSGTSLMAYSGTCGDDNIEKRTLPYDYFHAGSIQQVRDHIEKTIPNVGTRTSTGNMPPVVNAGSDFVIPARTPFELSAAAFDDDGDRLTINWEEFDIGPQQDLKAGDNGESPLFRSWPPNQTGIRTIPIMENILKNQSEHAETLPTTKREMKFRVTARDGRGGVATDEMVINTLDAGVAFAVTSPNTSSDTWQGNQTAIIRWETADTHLASVDSYAQQVDIYLSTNGGFNFTKLATAPNVGAYQFTVPNTPTQEARIKIKAHDNIFFDISDANFTIVEGVAPADSNDQISEALAIEPGDSLHPGVSYDTDVDLYEISVVDNQRVGFDIDTPGSDLDPVLRLFDSSGTQVWTSDDDVGPAPEDDIRESYIDYFFGTGGTYYLGVSAFGNSSYDINTGLGDVNTSTTGTYELHVLDLDGSDQIGEARSIAVDTADTGFLSSKANVEMWSFAVTQGQRVGFDIDRDPTDGLDAMLRIFDSSGQELAANDDGLNAGPAPEESTVDPYLEYTFSSAGTYYLGVSPYKNDTYNVISGLEDTLGNSTGRYTLRLFDQGNVPDPDDQVAESTRVTINNVGSGYSIDRPGDVDMFSIDVATDQRLAFMVEHDVNSSFDSVLRLFDTNAQEIGVNDDVINGTVARDTIDSYIEMTFRTPGTYFFGVSGFGNSQYDPLHGGGDTIGSTGSYSIAVENRGIDPVSQFDTIGEAFDVSVGTTISSSIDVGEVEIYRLSASQGDTLGFDIDTPSSTLDSVLRLFDQSGNQLDINSSGFNQGPAPESDLEDSYLVYPFTQTGTYYIGVSGFSNDAYNPIDGTGDVPGTTGDFDLRIELVASQDIDDQISEATDVQVGSTVSDSIDLLGDVDMFRFTANANETISIDADAPNADLDTYIRVFNSSGQELGSNDDAVGLGDEFDSRESYLEITLPSTGDYFVGVSSYNNNAYDALTGSGDIGGTTTGTYNLILSEVDSDDQLHEAISISVGDTKSAEINIPTDVDMYSFSASENQRIGFDIDSQNSTLDSVLRIFDLGGNEIMLNDDAVGPEPEFQNREAYIEHQFAAGSYFVAVSSFQNFAYDPESGLGDFGLTSGTYDLILRDLDATRVIGDSTGDGIFDTADLIAIFQANKYQTGEPATFEEGDWNGDGVFDSTDLIEALRAGTFVSGAKGPSERTLLFDLDDRLQNDRRLITDKIADVVFDDALEI